MAKQGKIFHIPSQRSLNYGELAPHAAKLKVPQDPALKQNQDYRLIGRHRKRLDGPQKVTGRADFGIDIDIPNLRIAVLIQCPTFGGQLQSYDDSEARTVVGVEDITPIAGGIAIVAQKYYQARKAADRMKINWNHGPNESLSSKEIYESLEQVADDRLQKMVNAREVRNVLRSSKQSLDLTYHVPFAAHVTMEPMNCTAHFSSEKCEVWAPTQSPGLAQQLVHELTGLPLSQIDIHATFLGGGFGRRLAQDYVVQAVAISMAVQKPIKLIWSREDDMQHDFYRPVTVHRIRVAIDAEQQPQFYGHTVAGPSIFSEALGDWVPAILPPWLPGIIKSSLAATISGFVRLTDKDPTALEGIKELVYTIPYQQTNFTRFDHGIPVGFWRSVGHSYSGFVVESVMDELAHFLDQDPYHYRRNLLKKSPRHLAVLEQLADKSSWLQSPPPGVHRGLAIHASFGSICGQVAEIMIDPSTKQLQVKRIVCVIDCGRTIDPSTVEAQISGGIIFALSATLYGEITIEGGQVQQSNFHDYPIMRYSECPQIEVSIMTSDEPPAGVGEPGVPPLAASSRQCSFCCDGQEVAKSAVKAEWIKRDLESKNGRSTCQNDCMAHLFLNLKPAIARC